MDSLWEELWDLPIWLKLALTATFVVAIVYIESSNEYISTVLNNTMSKLLLI